jgi:hypothetical protein
MKISEIKALPKGVEAFEGLEGIIKMIKPVQNHADSGHGEWFSQWVLMVESEAKDSPAIGVNFNNMMVGEEFKGKKVLITGKIKFAKPYVNKKGETVQGLSTSSGFEVFGMSSSTVTPKTEEKGKETPKEPQKQASPELSTGDKPDWDNINLRKDRMIALAYSKDLAVAGKININEICYFAEEFTKYCYNGINLPTKAEQEEQVKVDSNNDDSSIPF